jgi:hypothetical protein
MNETLTPTLSLKGEGEVRDFITLSPFRERVGVRVF